jgi:hypothetical protein
LTDEASSSRPTATRSLADVVPAVAAALGVDRRHGGAHRALVLPDAPAYVVFLVDGLGAELLERYAHAAPYLSSLLGTRSPAPPACPSTTATSLTSLGTGLTPGAHGLVGFTSRCRAPGAAQRAAVGQATSTRSSGSRTRRRSPGCGRPGCGHLVNKREFRGSGLTVAAHRGADYVGADRVGERIAAVLAAASHAPSLTYVYDGDLDWTGHRYGVASTQWLQQLAMIDAEAEQLREALPADGPAARRRRPRHGRLPAQSRIDVDEHLELREGVR